MGALQVFHSPAARSTACFSAVAALAFAAAGAAIGMENASPGGAPLGVVKLVEGSAMMSQGANYVDATTGMKLYGLDRIMVLEDSSVVLELANGCVYELQASQMLRVQATDSCATLAARANARVDMTQVERSAKSQIQPRADADAFIPEAAAAAAAIPVAAAAAAIPVAAAAAPVAVAAAAAPAIAAAAAPAGAFFALWGSSGAAVLMGTGAVATVALLANDSSNDNEFRPPNLSPG